MSLFYDPEIAFDSETDFPESFYLNSEESRHCAKVMRMRTGDRVHVANGKGCLFTGNIKSVDQKSCEIEISECKKSEPKGFSLHLAVAPVKNMARFEWFLEKATEIGIDRITPLICSRSEKIHVRSERLKKILVSAMKQSLNLFLPQLNEPVHLSEFIGNNHADAKFIAWCENMDDPLLSKVCPPGKEVIVLIGPEGDFSPEEVSLAKKAAFIPISLGKNRLRTETAALAACFTIHFINKNI